MKAQFCIIGREHFVRGGIHIQAFPKENTCVINFQVLLQHSVVLILAGVKMRV